MNSLISSRKKRVSVLFYGAIGGRGAELTVGGGETGNRKTIEYLHELGFIVQALGKPYPRGRAAIRYVRYGYELLGVAARVFFRLALNPDIRIVHISGFYMHLIYHEALLLIISKLLNRRVVYEMRGSGVRAGYTSRSKFYRILFTFMLRRADFIFTQGLRYTHFISTISRKPCVHYPNCNDLYKIVRRSDYDPENIREADQIRLVCFGRVVPSKGIDIAIKVCSALRQRGIDARLSIIGSGIEQYISDLKNLISSQGVENSVVLKPAMSMKELIPVLLETHFFVFPSTEKREGQSNSLTESMALGVVPVASKAGFNEEIIDDAQLLADQVDNADEYCDIIMNVLRMGLWKEKSIAARRLVEERYNTQIALSALKKAYY